MLLLSDDVPYTEALASREGRVVLPTDLRTDMLDRLPPAVRAHATFSAAMVHGEYLAVIDRVLRGLVAGDLSMAEAFGELDRMLAELGFPPLAESQQGDVTEHRTRGRINLILSHLLAQAGNHGQWERGMHADLREDEPCWEFYRAFPRNEPRSWGPRFLAAGGPPGGVLGSGTSVRLIARKDDPVWQSRVLNRFGTPYPPFDFNSGYRFRGVDRDRAVELGLIDEDEIPGLPPDGEAFLSASSAFKNHPAAVQQAILDELGHTVEFGDDDVLTMRRPAE